MSEESKHNGVGPSVPWKEYVDKADGVITDRLKSFEDETRRVSAAHDKAHDREHQMAELAVQTAVVPMDKRITLVTDDMKTYASKESVALVIKAAEDRRIDVDKVLNTLTNQWSKLSGQKDGVAIVASVLALAALFLSIVAQFK